MKEISVFAPATVANVACGFDIFGFALNTPGDEIVVKMVDRPGVTIVSISGDEGRLPKDPHKNTAGVSVLKLLEHLGSDQGFEISVHKKMPLGSGLGSSAASAVGSLFAVNELLGKPLTSHELLPFAMEGERIACGSAHADNVAPGLLGGFVLVRSYSPLDVVKVPCKIPLFAAVLHPHIEIRTEDARKILKPEVTMRQHVTQTGNAAGLIVGLMSGDAALIQRSLEDVIVEPLRATLIPGFQAIKRAALDAGCLGCSISGSGPSIFVLTTSQVQAEQVGQAMEKACQAEGLSCTLHVSAMNEQGPKILG